MFALIAALVIAVSCGDEDDPVDQVDDTTKPVVTISSPADGSTVETLDETATINIEFVATDETELASVVVDFNGTQILEVTSFVDFLKYTGSIAKEDVADGSYVITITATDLGGNTATATSTFTKTTANPYIPLDNEVFYMGFDGNYVELISETAGTAVGTPGYLGSGYAGNNAYKGATDAYLKFGTSALQSNELTFSFFMKLDVTADRAGILVMGPADAANPDAQNVRTSGFRFFREASGDKQIFKWNFGTGSDEVWIDGGDAAKLDPTVDEWHHFGFILGESTAYFYIDGVLVSKKEDHLGLDLTGCDLLTIGSGAPRFTGWNHLSDNSAIDELRIFDKALTEAELSAVSGVEIVTEPTWDPDPKLTPLVSADAVEVMRMSFDTDFSISGITATATAVGTPSVVTGGVSGKAYQGAVDSYLTVPTTDIVNNPFSVSMWIKVDNDPNRAGILVIGPPDEVNTTTPNNRTSGIRFFREASDYGQRYKLNVGNGTADSWADGGRYAEIPTGVTEWRHVAFTVNDTLAQVYMNGILVTSSKITGLDWTNCDIMSFGSGAPRFTEWGHLADESMFDELRIYKGVLNPTQIAALKAEGN